MITEWVCDKCYLGNQIEHDKSVGVWEIYQQIKDEHYKANRFCVFDRNAVRIKVVSKSYQSRIRVVIEQ